MISLIMFSVTSQTMTRSSSSSSDTASLAQSASGDWPQDARFGISENNHCSDAPHRRCRLQPPPPLLRSCLKIKSHDASLRISYRTGTNGIPSPRQVAMASFRSISASMRSLSPRSLSSPISSPTKKWNTAKEQTTQSAESKYHFAILDTISSFFHYESSEKYSRNDTDTTEDGGNSVRFDNVSIREYNLDVGVHPSVSLGPAVTFGWKYEDSIQGMKLNEYEMMRAEEHRRQGPFRELALSSAERTRRLRACGVTHEEIEECMTEVEKSQRKRIRTLKQLHRRPVEERLEGMAKGIKTALGIRKSQKKAEKDLWADAESYFDVQA